MTSSLTRGVNHPVRSAAPAERRTVLGCAVGPCVRLPRGSERHGAGSHGDRPSRPQRARPGSLISGLQLPHVSALRHWQDKNGTGCRYTHRSGGGGDVPHVVRLDKCDSDGGWGPTARSRSPINSRKRFRFVYVCMYVCM